MCKRMATVHSALCRGGRAGQHALSRPGHCVPGRGLCARERRVCMAAGALFTE